jgi:glycosyltransferase involved in cell wall biosynthesis
MRILISTHNRSVIGGIERYLQVVIPALAERGHAVGLLYECLSNPGLATVDEADGRIPAWSWTDIHAESPARRSLLDWQPEVVYSHGSESLEMEGWLLDRFPTALFAHVYLGTCISGKKCHSFPQLRPCSREFGLTCLALYYPRRCGGLNPITAWRMFQSHSVRNSRLPSYRAILVASTHMYSEYLRHGVSRDQLRLVPLPLADGTVDDLRPAPKVPQGRILFVGRLTDLKGVDFLLRAIPSAAAELGKRLSVTVAGDGPECAKLQALADEINVAVNFAGWIGSERKLKLMREADLLAVPSLWPEPFALVGIEAGSVGLPAVGYAVGGIPDWLVAGETGEVAPGDPPTVRELADAVVRALRDPVHYSKLSRGAWELSRQFTMEKHVAKLESALQAVCGTTPTAPAVVNLNT